ncbi:MAG: hypothetical protein R2710_03425 [Acidimicrobiales bacterium]
MSPPWRPMPASSPSSPTRSSPWSPRRAREDRSCRSRLRHSGSLVRVKIWSADGTIVYSDEGRLIGEQFELDDESVELLAAGPSDVEAQAEVSDLDEPENKYEERAVKLLEVYLPIYTSTGTPLLFEAYFRYEGVAEAGRRAWLRFARDARVARLLVDVAGASGLLDRPAAPANAGSARGLAAASDPGDRHGTPPHRKRSPRWRRAGSRRCHLLRWLRRLARSTATPRNR